MNDISAFGSFVSIAQKAVSLYHDVDAIDRSYQQNLLTLLDTEEIAVLWHLLRKKARVTGSSLHSAIGLRGLKDQKRHYEVFVNKNEQLFPQSVQDRLKHGTECEMYAVATLVGRFLPIYFPEYHFVEEGCYVLAGENIDVLGEVSPDGSIRRLNSDYDDTPILQK